jgi:hypothetical protein
MLSVLNVCLKAMTPFASYFYEATRFYICNGGYLRNLLQLYGKLVPKRFTSKCVSKIMICFS